MINKAMVLHSSILNMAVTYKKFIMQELNIPMDRLDEGIFVITQTLISNMITQKTIPKKRRKK